MRPFIGITGNYSLEKHCFYLQEYYVSSIKRTGGAAVILPPTMNEDLIEDYLRLCQGLLISGGGDLDPSYWGELPDSRTGEINPLRDGFELSIARKAFLYRKALLGICRGCQVMNVAAGGSLVQDIPGPMSHMQKAPRAHPFHDIFIASGSRLHKIMGKKIIRVNSFHHQAVRQEGDGMIIAAMSAEGTIEAIESREHPFYIGVQWHPECLQNRLSLRLFAALNKAAQTVKKAE